MLSRLFYDVVSLLGRRHREIRIRNELEALSDQELIDIGLKRGDIHGVAREAALKY
jgi:uncharacterized protein YjiS (DUF1127 family)